MDINTPLYGKYTLKDLTMTNYDLPNLPNDAELANLKWLAKVLTNLEKDIGPFGIVSAFRSYQVQNAVYGYPPLQEVNRKKSFHEAGMAVDIYPLTMTLEAFFGKILASDYWVNNLGEIAIKPTQNSIHISLPTSSLKSKLLIYENGTYRALTASEAEKYRAPYELNYTPITTPIEPLYTPNIDTDALNFDWDYITDSNNSTSYLNTPSTFNFDFLDDFSIDTTEKKIGLGAGILALLLGAFILFR